MIRNDKANNDSLTYSERFTLARHRHRKTKNRASNALIAMLVVFPFILGFFPYSVIQYEAPTISLISGIAFYSAGYFYGKAHYSIEIEKLKEKLDYIERNKNNG